MQGQNPDDMLIKVKEEQISDNDMPMMEVQAEDGTPFIFTCDICVDVFTTKAALKKHKEQHMQEVAPRPKQPKVYCKYCKIPFNTIVLLSKHMYEEHNEAPKGKSGKTGRHPQFACHICKKSFQTAAALTTHVGWHKRGDGGGNSLHGNKQAKVLKQNKIIDKLSAAQNHKKAEEAQTTLSKYQCKTCLAELPSDTALQVHILEKHRNVSAIMLVPRCNVCNKDFGTQDEYETHKRLHDFLERQKQHEKQLVTDHNDQIEVPKASPKQQKSYPCKYCKAAFSRSDTLGLHMRQFHKDFIQTEFKCTQCDRVFDKQNSLTIHLKVHEKQKALMPQAVSKPLFSCSICNLGFNLPKDLRAHTISAHPF